MKIVEPSSCGVDEDARSISHDIFYKSFPYIFGDVRLVRRDNGLATGRAILPSRFLCLLRLVALATGYMLACTPFIVLKLPFARCVSKRALSFCTFK